MLTFEQLAAIRERAEKVSEIPTMYHSEDEGRTVVFGNFDHFYFIANAFSDVPALVSEIIRLRTALAEMAHYEAPYGLDATGYEVLRIMARQALNDGGDAE